MQRSRLAGDFLANTCMFRPPRTDEQCEIASRIHRRHSHKRLRSVSDGYGLCFWVQWSNHHIDFRKTTKPGSCKEYYHTLGDKHHHLYISVTGWRLNCLFFTLYFFPKSYWVDVGIGSSKTFAPSSDQLLLRHATRCCCQWHLRAWRWGWFWSQRMRKAGICRQERGIINRGYGNR